MADALWCLPMPSIKVEKQSKLSAGDTFKRVTDMLSNDKDLKKLDPSYKSEFDSGSMSGTATGSMFKAKLNVSDAGGGGSTVALVVDIPFHLALAKGMIEKTLQKKLEEALA
jgi:hypothetical protein